MAEPERRVWARNVRYEFMEWKLFWEGQLNRSDLEAAFDISTPQASVDLKNYRGLAEGNVEYDSTAKSFVPGAAIRPRFLVPSADRLLLQLLALMSGALPRDVVWFKTLPAIDMAPDVARHVDPECLRLILGAMRSRSALRIRYQSLTNSRWRVIAPHALAFDGARWHVRAWACDHKDFRDFVLSRIDEFGGAEAASYEPADDVEWHTTITLRVLPHPGLTDDQRRAIERDYGMVDGAREVEVRLSMAFYFIKRHNLDLIDLPPERVQLRLENLAEVGLRVAAAKEETRRRVIPSGGGGPADGLSHAADPWDSSPA